MIFSHYIIFERVHLVLYLFSYSPIFSSLSFSVFHNFISFNFFNCKGVLSDSQDTFNNNHIGLIFYFLIQMARCLLINYNFRNIEKTNGKYTSVFTVSIIFLFPIIFLFQIFSMDRLVCETSAV